MDSSIARVATEGLGARGRCSFRGFAIKFFYSRQNRLWPRATTCYVAGYRHTTVSHNLTARLRCKVAPVNLNASASGLAIPGIRSESRADFCGHPRPTHYLVGTCVSWAPFLPQPKTICGSPVHKVATVPPCLSPRKYARGFWQRPEAAFEVSAT